MTLSSLAKRSLLAGSALLATTVVALSLSAPAQAAMSAQEFIASLDELKQVCHRMDLPMWVKKNESGCGKTIACTGDTCFFKPKKIRIPQRPIPVGIVALVRKDGADRDHEHDHDVGHDSGKGKGRGSQGPTGAGLQ